MHELIFPPHWLPAYAFDFRQFRVTQPGYSPFCNLPAIRVTVCVTSRYTTQKNQVIAAFHPRYSLRFICQAPPFNAH